MLLQRNASRNGRASRLLTRVVSLIAGVLLTTGALSARAFTVIYSDATAGQLAGPVTNIGGAVLSGAGSLSEFYTSMSAWNPWGISSGKEYQYAGQTSYSGGVAVAFNPGSITYTLGGLHTKVEFLAGSPDNYNEVQFFRAGQFLGSKSGAEWWGNGRYNTQYVMILALDSGEYFDEVRFISPLGAFEFANVSVTPVPLPASAWLFLSALAGLVAIGRRRKMLAAT